jgi:hypothetical protein
MSLPTANTATTMTHPITLLWLGSTNTIHPLYHYAYSHPATPQKMQGDLMSLRCPFNRAEQSGDIQPAARAG